MSRTLDLLAIEPDNLICDLSPNERLPEQAGTAGLRR